VLALAAALSVPLIWYRGWPIVAIGIPSLYFCFGYTGGPWPLAYRGLGEFFVVLFFGLVAVTGSAYVQSGHWYVEAIVAGLQVGMLSTVLIAINNLRDIDTVSIVVYGSTVGVWLTPTPGGEKKKIQHEAVLYKAGKISTLNH